jgi:peptidoglycan hydrolase-like protein with peptidoglycan-binding domain
MGYSPLNDAPAIRLYQSGDIVAWLQRMVGAKDDGFYGPATARAVMARQTALGFPATGEASLRFVLALAGAQIAKPAPPPPPLPAVDYGVEDIVGSLPRSKSVPQKVLSSQVGIVIHHSATHSSLAGSTPQGYARYHTVSLGWPCIGYDVVIQPNEGKVYQTAYLADRNYHSGAQNGNYYGICISGNYDEEIPTDKHYALIVAAIKDLISRHEIATRKNWDPVIEPHSKFSSKTCPGKKIDMDRIRQALRK